MRWAGHVPGMGDRRGAYRVLVGRPNEVPDLDGRKILKWIFKKWDGGAWIGLMWLRIGTGEGSLVNGML